MTYTKPNIAVLGKAAAVLGSTMYPKVGPFLETAVLRGPTPAYDLDE
jgi:hypothetical protein